MSSNILYSFQNSKNVVVDLDIILGWYSSDGVSTHCEGEEDEDEGVLHNSTGTYFGSGSTGKNYQEYHETNYLVMNDKDSCNFSNYERSLYFENT